jgi:flagellar protein FlgJ
MNNSPALYNDFQGLAALKHQAREDQAGSLGKVAKQFESLFVQMMVKQMRQASQGEGLFDSDKTRFYQEMYDKQLSMHLAESGGIGIGDVLKRQLGGKDNDGSLALSGLQPYREHPVMPAIRYLRTQPEPARPVEPPPATEAAEPTPALDSPERFVHSLWPAAQQAAASIGLPPEALLAQAALETGWGGHVMPGTDGRSSHNLFGIKADQRWSGDQVKRETLEYEEGIAVKRRENFRSYASYAESFQDYVEFLKSSPRYAQALDNAHDSQAYFSALQEAGYATDPRYAEKILRVMQGPEMQAALDRLKTDESRPI